MIEKLKESGSVFLTDYRGLSVDQMAKLRKALRKSDAEYRVVKNTLAKIAAEKQSMKELSEMLSGPIAMAFTNDPISSAKVLYGFTKEFKQFEIRGAIIDGEVFLADEVKKLAELPPRETLIATLIGRLGSPIHGLVNILNSPIQGLVQVLDSISQQKAA